MQTSTLGSMLYSLIDVDATKQSLARQDTRLLQLRPSMSTWAAQMQPPAFPCRSEFSAATVWRSQLRSQDIGGRALVWRLLVLDSPGVCPAGAAQGLGLFRAPYP